MCAFLMFGLLIVLINILIFKSLNVYTTIQKLVAGKMYERSLLNLHLFDQKIQWKQSNCEVLL